MNFAKGAFTLLAAGLATGHAHAEAPVAPPAAARTCWEIVRNRSTSDNNDKCVAMAGPLAAVKGGKLVLRMDDGKRKVFADSSEGTSFFGYALMDFYPATHIFVVGDMGDDAGEFQAIDGRTGRVTPFGQSQPHYAPHGDWVLLDTTEENENGGDRTSFSLLDARGDKPKTVWTSKGDPTTLPGTAEFIAWRDDAQAELALPNGFHLILTKAGDGAWHYDLAILGAAKPKPKEQPASPDAAAAPDRAARP